MDKKNKSAFLELINKLFDGTISKKEISILFSFFLNNQKITEWPNDFQEKSEVEAKIYTKINAKIHTQKEKGKVIPLYKRSIFKYAAAALIILLLSVPFVINQKGNSDTIDTPIVLDHNVVPGSNRAILTLDDGSEIDLDIEKNFRSDQITNNGKSLRYENSRTADHTEIAYNYLTIPRGGQYHIVLQDGTEVWLNSESQLKYPVVFAPNTTRNVELVYGEAYFDVSPSTQHNGAKFNVVTSHHNVAVLGTEFNIKAYKDENAIYTTLVEGKVALNTATEYKNLVPEQQAIFNKDNATITITAADVYNEVSWKNGVFSFENKTLKDIMKVLSRWYDVEVVFVDKALENEEFIGVLGKEQDIEDILSIIKNYSTIKNYTINGKTVLLE
ncbi:FecR domain-containing protein [uncultured Croceitalea sp.]|uniref:FecR family protein n=1 Tax=uncultured Croceitalea sp. TaxID=1798908 RepID=UPI003305A7A7